ncbi:ATP phosphoribosyltransferase [Candidatus Microgenomates bacterium]|nr:ATP phosphoribosyltransferase [Candidatus Microgenomates bacterium]
MNIERVSKISLAIDGGHNIRTDTESCLKAAGFQFEVWENGSLHALVRGDSLLRSITLNRGGDIPLRLDEGVNDFGVFGRDVLREAQLGGVEIEEIEALGISICRVALEVPKSSKYKRPEDLVGARIATHLPNLTKSFFREHNTAVRIVSYTGKEEGAPAAGAADAVVAIYSSGTAAEENKLRLIGTLKESTLLESEGVLVASTRFLSERGSDLIVSQFIDRFRQLSRVSYPFREPPSVNTVMPISLIPQSPIHQTV